MHLRFVSSLKIHFLVFRLRKEAYDTITNPEDDF